MTDNEMESGFELVLDNRRLIAMFAVFVVICGCFFVLGYSTGKRQGEIAATGSMTGRDSTATLGTETKTGDAIAEVPAIDDEVQKDLQWYQSVNRGGSDSMEVAPPESPEPVRESAKSASESVPMRAAEPVQYSIQLNAFKTRQQAIKYAEIVRSKGFDSRVEPPEDSSGLYKVKVGSFSSRPEATTMQLRLQKSGFKGFINTK
jgi:cell division protein FtsN